MIQPPDSLVAALRAVPSRHECHRDDPDMCCYDEISASALEAAAREWIRRLMPTSSLDAPGYARSWQNGYDSAIAEVARRLGL